MVFLHNISAPQCSAKWFDLTLQTRKLGKTDQVWRPRWNLGVRSRPCFPELSSSQLHSTLKSPPIFDPGFSPGRRGSGRDFSLRSHLHSVSSSWSQPTLAASVRRSRRFLPSCTGTDAVIYKEHGCVCKCVLWKCQRLLQRRLAFLTSCSTIDLFASLFLGGGACRRFLCI